MGHIPHLYLPPPWEGPILTLSDTQLHHLERVLRTREGDPLSYTDGTGRVGSGRLADGAVARGEETTRRRPVALTLAVSPPRSRDRARFVVEKLAELGVARLVWARTRRTEGRPPPVGKARVWAAAALEQSRGAWAMEIGESTPDALDPADLIVAHPDGQPGFPAGRRTLLVGPEGGFEPGELPGGAPLVSFGPTVLRVETAAVVGAALLRVGIR